MNDTVIENLLFRAPSPEPPADLLALLQTQIVLPENPPAIRDHVNGWQNPLRRWFPVLAFGLFLVSCAVILGVQANLVLQLRRENESLRAAAADLKAREQNDPAAAASRAQLAELAQLRADHADLLRLRAEVAALRKRADETAQLQADNEKLAAAAQAEGTPAESPEQKAQRESAECEMHLKQIGVALRIWAGDNGDRYPTSVIEMTNELGAPIILICPGDRSNESEVKNLRTLGWQAFRPELTSYQFILSGEKEDSFPQRIIAKCPIHGHVLTADCFVATNALASGHYREATIDGRLNLVPVDSGNSSVKP
jgi:hypothetical protein